MAQDEVSDLSPPSEGVPAVDDSPSPTPTQDASALSAETSSVPESHPAPQDENLSVEQQKRIDLLNEYEELTAGDRGARNAAIDAFEADWRERWVALHGEMEQARAERAAILAKEGVPEEAHGAILAKEAAALLEKYDADKDLAGRKLEETLVTPQRWVDFLKDKSQEMPEDPTLSSLIEEAEKSPDAGISGLGGTPAKGVTLADLVHSIGKDGAIDYKRGLTTVIRDVGTRLDVKKVDDRDIEAALKIAAQKFDMDKGLMLTGDAAFKTHAAEIAGRLGLPLQNAEPEVLMAWKRGAAQNQALARAVVPSVDRGITGELAVTKPLMELRGPVLLKADLSTIENAAELGVTPDGEGVVSMPAERVLKANAAIKRTPIDNIRVLVKADISKTDGGLDEDDKEKLREYGLLDDNGNLTNEAKDVVIVRDDRVMRTRNLMGEATEKAFGKNYLTSGEFVRDKAHKHVELKQEAEIKKDQHEQERDDPFGEIRKEAIDHAADKIQEQQKQEIKAPEHDAWGRSNRPRVISNNLDMGR